MEKGINEKNTVDYFPKWNPTRFTKDKIFDNLSSKNALKHFRASSSNFASNKTVREIIFNKSNHKCCNCESNKDLQIDHIKSVLKCFQEGLIYFCNTEENLQTLCRICNIIKGY